MKRLNTLSTFLLLAIIMLSCQASLSEDQKISDAFIGKFHNDDVKISLGYTITKFYSEFLQDSTYKQECDFMLHGEQFHIRTEGRWKVKNNILYQTNDNVIINPKNLFLEASLQHTQDSDFIVSYNEQRIILQSLEDNSEKTIMKKVTNNMPVLWAATTNEFISPTEEIILYVLYIVCIILLSVSMWKIYAKTGQIGWASIIPIYNILALLKIVNKPWWWIFLLILPIINIFILIIITNSLSISFGKSRGFTVGLIILPLLFFPILAFGKAEYIGKENQNKFTLDYNATKNTKNFCVYCGSKLDKLDKFCPNCGNSII